MRMLPMRIIVALILCLGVVLGGTLGYIAIEGYSPGEAFYMTAITMSTVGFGEIKPLSAPGRAFTTGLIFMSFLTLAFTGHALGESLLEKVWSGRVERNKMLKRIQSLKGHYIICGYGRVGAATAAGLEEAGVDFVIIETNESRRSTLLDKGYAFLEGDATHEELLIEAGIKKATGLLALLNSDPDNLFVVLSARELNPTLKIISRAGESSAGAKIVRAGADDVVSPLVTAGRKIAHDMLSATGRRIEERNPAQGPTVKPGWLRPETNSPMIGQTLDNLFAGTSQRIIGLRRGNQDQLMPAPETQVKVGDQLLILDACMEDTVSAATDFTTTRKLVIVDDSPVILKLYTRLFQKAGFIPLTANNGREGAELVLREKPVAAILDCHMPLMSGIEACRAIRSHAAGQSVKLILFTTDNRPQTQKEALQAGADAVVVKSPEAKEIIDTVVNIIQNLPPAA